MWKSPWVLCLLLFAANLAVQFGVHGPALGAGVLNRSSPSSTDTEDYVRRANLLTGSADAFAAAFGDGHRTPGYPLFLAAVDRLSPGSPDSSLRVARVTQVFLSASLILLAFATLRNLTGSPKAALGAAALVAAWPPLHHFSPILIAETCSLFVYGLLIWVLSLRLTQEAGDRRAVLAAAFLVALLVALKPNHLLLAVPVALVLGWGAGGPFRPLQASFAPDGSPAPGRWKPGRMVAFLALTGALIVPWSLFVSIRNDRPVLLTTTSDANLFIGTGVAPQARDPKDARTLPYRFATRWIPAGNSEGTGPSQSAGPIWREHPVRTALYCTVKVLHGFGFSMRGARDYALLVLLGASLWAARRVWRDREKPQRVYVVFFSGVLAVTVFQLFLYLPNQRLKTVLFDLPALLMIALWLSRAARVAPIFGTIFNIKKAG